MKVPAFNMGNAVIVIVYLIGLSVDISQASKPIWIIGSMANTIKDMESLLLDGANGLQVDVEVDLGGYPKYMHDSTCNCGGYSKFYDYLNHLQKITTSETNLLNAQCDLLLLDLHVGAHFCPCEKYSIAKNVAKALTETVWKKEWPFIYVLIRIPNSLYELFIPGILDALRAYGNEEYLNHIGFAFDSANSRNRIMDILQSNNFTRHVWYGRGDRDSKPRNVDWVKKITELLEKNDGSTLILDKVYVWTLDETSAIEEAFLSGADAVVTNNVRNARIALINASRADRRIYINTNDYPWRMDD